MLNGESGVAKDEPEAARLMQLAANGGDAMAQSNLGYMLNNGVGIVKNPTQAIVWWRKAAAQNDESAIANLKEPAVIAFIRANNIPDTLAPIAAVQPVVAQPVASRTQPAASPTAQIARQAPQPQSSPQVSSFDGYFVCTATTARPNQFLHSSIFGGWRGQQDTYAVAFATYLKAQNKAAPSDQLNAQCLPDPSARSLVVVLAQRVSQATERRAAIVATTFAPEIGLSTSPYATY